MRYTIKQIKQGRLRYGISKDEKRKDDATATGHEPVLYTPSQRRLSAAEFRESACFLLTRRVATWGLDDDDDDSPRQLSVAPSPAGGALVASSTGPLPGAGVLLVDVSGIVCRGRRGLPLVDGHAVGARYVVHGERPGLIPVCRRDEPSEERGVGLCGQSSGQEGGG